MQRSYNASFLCVSIETMAKCRRYIILIRRFSNRYTMQSERNNCVTALIYRFRSQECRKGTTPKHFKQKQRKKHFFQRNKIESKLIQGKKRTKKTTFPMPDCWRITQTHAHRHFNNHITCGWTAFSWPFVQTLNISSQSKVIIALITFDTVSCCSLAVCICFFPFDNHFFCFIVILWMHFHLACSANTKIASRCENALSKFN